MTQSITCPSGLAGHIRGMRAREERILADRALAKNGVQLDQILAACWEHTIDSGPYAFEGDSVDWSKVLQGDRFFVMLQIRVQSYGPDYAFSIPCENRGCRNRIDWELDLRDLPVRPLTEDNRKAFANGNRFTARLPEAQKDVTFHLPTGHDERRLAALRRQARERPITTMLGLRLDAIDGVEPRDKHRFIEDLGMADVAFLVSEFERVDCGVDTELEVECPECNGITRVELPFDKGFFLPEKKRPASLRSSPQ